MGVVFVLCAGGFTGGHSRGLHVCRVCVWGGGGGYEGSWGWGLWVMLLYIHTTAGMDRICMYMASPISCPIRVASLITDRSSMLGGYPLTAHRACTVRTGSPGQGRGRRKKHGFPPKFSISGPEEPSGRNSGRSDGLRSTGGRKAFAESSQRKPTRATAIPCGPRPPRVLADCGSGDSHALCTLSRRPAGRGGDYTHLTLSSVFATHFVSGCRWNYS